MKEIAKGNIKMLLLSLTGTCNLGCKYCYADSYNEKMMTFEVAKKAIALVQAQSNEFIIQFSGGEPLLNINLIQKISQYVKANNINAKMQIQTNGTLLTAENIDILVEEKIAIGISIDGNQEIHDAQRPFRDNSGSFKKIMAGLEILKNKKINIGITCVVTKKNVNFLEKLVTLSYYWGNIKKIGFDLIRGQGRGSEISKPSEPELRQGLTKAFSLGEKFKAITGSKIIFAQLNKVEKLQNKELTGFSHCHAMNGAAIYVDVDGKIYACASLLGQSDYLIGDVEQGLDLAKQEAIKSKLELILKKCFSCHYFSNCGGACFARWMGCGDEDEQKLECCLKIAAIEWYQQEK